jgi:DNA-binding NarL/FixJ family response regulator
VDATKPGAEESQLKCLLADDNEAILHALESLLAGEGMEVLGVARTGLDALALLRRHLAGALVLDARLPDISGLEVARRAAELARKHPAIVFYTSYADSTFVNEAIEAGARAVVLKDASPENLLEALVHVGQGELYVDPRIRRPARHATCRR